MKALKVQNILHKCFRPRGLQYGNVYNNWKYLTNGTGSAAMTKLLKKSFQVV